MIKPFADDKGSTSIADLTVENGIEAVVISGSLEVTRDELGLKHAQALKPLADASVEQLQAARDLPEGIVLLQGSAGESVPNPFA